MKQVIKVIKSILMVFIGFVVLINIMLLTKKYLNSDETPDILGYKWYTVLSGSMEDVININDVVIVKKVLEKDLKEGDIISFKSGNSIVTHRIINIDTVEGKKVYTTKGDSNNTEDKPNITYQDIEGKLMFTIPKLGNILTICQNKITIMIIMIIIFVICLI